MTLVHLTTETPLGPLLLVGEAETGALRSIEFPRKDDGSRPDARSDRSAPYRRPASPPATAIEDDGRRLIEAARQLRDYFAGRRRTFELLLAPEGTPFQQRVWEELRRIPYGQTISYRELAARVGSPRAVRAVGGANGRNPLPIVVPCHRVIASDGTLAGFGGGVWAKRRLLELEGVRVDRPRDQIDLPLPRERR